MARVFFRESYCLRTRETRLFYVMIVMALAMTIFLGMLTFMLELTFVIGYPDEGTVKLFSKKLREEKS